MKAIEAFALFAGALPTNRPHHLSFTQSFTSGFLWTLQSDSQTFQPPTHHQYSTKPSSVQYVCRCFKAPITVPPRSIRSPLSSSPPSNDSRKTLLTPSRFPRRNPKHDSVLHNLSVIPNNPGCLEPLGPNHLHFNVRYLPGKRKYRRQIRNPRRTRRPPYRSRVRTVQGADVGSGSRRGGVYCDVCRARVGDGKAFECGG
ncbi:uncharacterized protein EV422DRAFT_539235 [Fimicolochytrium jonesii]|uniref:uncharacterized protein n=1 Tax=Fimicolochytrium jonesii TaxID=1396493 RepID=UPI0022FE79D0|nr:uncharacterized protein EV422DRAFT_539235 [Fimicolochytrium jonesii]KAI8818266.1 hypothetical protein EV422DRAFT_539235 [Fimicolochytrium jonesii]